MITRPVLLGYAVLFTSICLTTGSYTHMENRSCFALQGITNNLFHVRITWALIDKHRLHEGIQGVNQFCLYSS